MATSTLVIPEAFNSFPRLMTEDNTATHWHIFEGVFLNLAGNQLRHEAIGGLLASILPQAQYELLFAPNLRVDNIPAAPGVFDPALDDATIWKAMRTQYTLYTQALDYLQQVWSTYIDASPLEALNQPVVGLSNVSLAAQYLHVRDTFDALPADYLENFHAELNRPQPDVPFLAVIHRIALCKHVCHRERTLHDLNKIQLLKVCFAFGTYDVF
jgi:hypothetical protein